MLLSIECVSINLLIRFVMSNHGEKGGDIKADQDVFWVQVDLIIYFLNKVCVFIDVGICFAN